MDYEISTDVLGGKMKTYSINELSTLYRPEIGGQNGDL
jgi:hypothetical protein